MKLRLAPILPLLLLIAACNQSGTSNVSSAKDSTSLFKPANIQEQMVHNRAIEAVIWGMPAVNLDIMYQAMVRDAKGGYNTVAYWSKLQDWHIQTLTPNPDVCYFMSFFNLKESGPMVLEVPPAVGGVINGTVMDIWQSALEDVGIAGVDKGKGGKYLITPPDYKDAVPAGYISMPCDTYQGYFLLRSMLSKSASDEEVAKAVAYGKQIKFYKFSQTANPPATTYVDMAGKLYDAVIPYDLRYYESLNRVVQNEPWLLRDKAMIDQLKTIGIERGKPFSPDARTKEILQSAIKDAQAWFVYTYENSFSPYFEGTHWTFPTLGDVPQHMSAFFMIPDAYPVDGRGLTYTYAYFSPKHGGKGQYYLLTIRDKAGNFLDCSKTYHLNVPAKAPVNQYWSATVYDRETHALMRNAKVLSRSSQSQGLQVNPDGSVDIYFGPKAPAGKENNWAETGSGKNFEILFRFYGPEKALFEKTWKMPDLEEVR